MRERDLTKAMLKKFNLETHWKKLKKIENKINVEIKKLKPNFYNTKISKCVQELDSN